MHISLGATTVLLEILGFLARLFNYVANGEVEGKKYHFTPSLSYNLGIITHYITDFFTHSHIGEGIGGARHHLQYEDFVDNYRLSIRESLIEKDYSKTIKLVDNTDELKLNFESYMETYRQLPASPDLDLELAISKSIEICVNLLILRYERLHKLDIEMNRKLNRVENEKILLLK